jgi:hypothetical protein
MNIANYSSKLLALTALSASFLLTGCDSSTNETTHRYEISVQNITANQALSPVVIFAHEENYHLWQAGKMASVGLEYLAEGGSHSELIKEVKTNSYYLDHTTGNGAIGSGMSETITFNLKDTRSVQLSLASMLVNTNDAFTGFRNINLDDLNKGESKTFTTLAWDAGTEKNTEAAGSIPGPADGGEGFNASRSGDANFIAVHQGVITSDDGLADSILDESHRFDNPVAKVTIKRID